MTIGSPKISIIIPVYNTEKDLRRCIDSVLAQTVCDFELLLVDDGSTDASDVICDEYAARDSRIRVFHKLNGGVSSARNVGLDNACGEWITFVDSDDEVKGLGSCVCDECDLIFGSVEVHGLNGSTSVQSFSESRLCGEEIKPFLETNLQLTTFSTCWAKYFKRELIGELRFDTSAKIGEDTIFMLKYLSQVERISFDPDFFYQYYLLVSYECRYQQPISESIYTMSTIFDAYVQLGIRNTAFERNVFTNYKGFCQQDIYSNPSVWYGDPKVKSIYEQVKKELGFDYRIKYSFMSIPLFSSMVNLLRA